MAISLLNILTFKNAKCPRGMSFGNVCRKWRSLSLQFPTSTCGAARQPSAARGVARPSRSHLHSDFGWAPGLAQLVAGPAHVHPRVRGLHVGHDQGAQSVFLLLNGHSAGVGQRPLILEPLHHRLRIPWNERKMKTLVHLRFDLRGSRFFSASCMLMSVYRNWDPCWC